MGFLFVLLLGLNWYDKQIRDDLVAQEKKELDLKCKKIRDSGIADGVEQHFEGNITPSMPIALTLSCDYETVTIKGSVDQILKSPYPDSTELVDPSAHINSVVTTDDYNFDGYNDVAFLTVNGEGSQASDTYTIFLFDVQTKQFVYNKELSKITNISIDNEKKQILLHEVGDAGGYTIRRYMWKGDMLVLDTTETCEGNKQALADQKGAMYTETIKRMIDGKEVIIKKETKSADKDSCAHPGWL